MFPINLVNSFCFKGMCDYVYCFTYILHLSDGSLNRKREVFVGEDKWAIITGQSLVARQLHL